MRVREIFMGLGLLTPLMCHAQSAAPSPLDKNIVVRTMPSVSESLATKGIATRESVIAALRNPDPYIRKLAAAKLEESRDPQALALISDALNEESDPQVVVTFASMLWALGSTDGQQRLMSFCTKTDEEVQVLVQAAAELALRGKSGLCTKSLTQAYSDSLPAGRRIQILSMLSEVGDEAQAASEEDIDKVVASGIADPRAAIRLASTTLLSRIGTINSARILSTAASREADPVVKKRMLEAQQKVSRTHPISKATTVEGSAVPKASITNIRPTPQCIPGSNCGSSIAVSNSFQDNWTTVLSQYKPPAYLSGFGIEAVMTVGPAEHNHTGATVVESVSTIVTSCPSQLNLCSSSGGSTTFPVGQQAGNDILTGTPHPALPNTFYDFHEYYGPTDALTTLGLQSCSADCNQIYTCNGTQIGHFTISYDLTKDYVTGSDGGTYAVTDVNVVKSATN